MEECVKIVGRLDAADSALKTLENLYFDAQQG